MEKWEIRKKTKTRGDPRAHTIGRQQPQPQMIKMETQSCEGLSLCSAGRALPAADDANLSQENQRTHAKIDDGDGWDDLLIVLESDTVA